MAGLMPRLIDKQEAVVSSYTRKLLKKALELHGEDSSEYKGIYNQYYRMPIQDISTDEKNRHFEAEMSNDFPKGLERFYKRVTVIDLLSKCASECSYCCRGYYDQHSLSTSQIEDIADFLASEPNLKEILITGGDPILASKKLKELITIVVEKAPNIRMIRLGTRMPVQSPDKFDLTLYDFFNSYRDKINIEIAMQINHPFELQPITENIIKGLQNVGVRVYSQNVLLKDVNDNIDTLVELYDRLRYLNVVPYYFYHALPIKGTENFRTTLAKGLELIKKLTSSGQISGMAKPMLSIMTDVGKVTLYQDSIVGYKGNHAIIKTEYTVAQRREWNPSYTIPENAFENEDGTLSVLYLDGPK